MKRSERAEAIDISRQIMAQLVTFPVASFSQPAVDMRLAMGKYMANFQSLTFVNEFIGTELLDCFEKARLAGATINTMDRVRKVMFAQPAPQFRFSKGVIIASIIFSFAQQVKIIAATEFRSRGEVVAMIDKMLPIIDTIKVNWGAFFFIEDYQNFVALSALLVQHLSDTERQLPRIIKMKFPINYPALALANRVYGDASRSDELIAENHSVHPAFMPLDIQALSE
jgi:hypothetical protein